MPFDDSEPNVYLISFDNRNWKVSAIVYRICIDIKNGKNKDEIKHNMNEQYKEDEIDDIIEKVFVFLNENSLIVGTENKKVHYSNKNESVKLFL